MHMYTIPVEARRQHGSPENGISVGSDSDFVSRKLLRFSVKATKAL